MAATTPTKSASIAAAPVPPRALSESVVPTQSNGIKDNGESDVDCGGPNAAPCTDGKTCATNADCQSKYCIEQSKVCAAPRSDDNVKNGDETDVDCGGANAPKCAAGKACQGDRDCQVACSYANKCVDAPSCKPHLGGDTCGKGEVGQVGTSHESCCRVAAGHRLHRSAKPGQDRLPRQVRDHRPDASVHSSPR